jgi:hypothetical protein
VALYIGSREQLAELLQEIDWQDVEITDWDDESTTFTWREGIYIVPENVCRPGELIGSLQADREKRATQPENGTH